MYKGEIIVAPATAPGGALSLLRMSGEGSIALCDRLFRGRRPLSQATSHTLHFGALYEGEELLDEVVVSLFHAPHSYTGEESVEISCHGSHYIQQRILTALCRLGARMATAGEFSSRAFLNGRLDLSQAEAVADLIAAESQAAHTLALRQMRGHYSQALDALHDRLLHLSSLLELELDFSEEDVEFADRGQLAATMEEISAELKRLEESFQLGNALREGVLVAIVGEPNVGKSTLLNRLAGDERALVSEIAGTTRDTIEERIRIEGVEFRLVDTAGLHETSDRIEQLGIERTHAAIERAHIVLHLIDGQTNNDNIPFTLQEGQHYLRVRNKCDLPQTDAKSEDALISAKTGAGIEELRHLLRSKVDTTALEQGSAIVSNSRHLEALHEAREGLQRALEALHNHLPSDLLAEELRTVAHPLGTITGAITSDDILHSIFSNFCIGK